MSPVALEEDFSKEKSIDVVHARMNPKGKFTRESENIFLGGWALHFLRSLLRNDLVLSSMSGTNFTLSTSLVVSRPPSFFATSNT